METVNHMAETPNSEALEVPEARAALVTISRPLLLRKDFDRDIHNISSETETTTEEMCLIGGLFDSW
ncbi:MAG: hypothetical protein PHY09_00860 [Desulfuromonadaceae bacterium]|nr:hypothetical protein [Desulfuromonadaceae bacterium]